MLFSIFLIIEVFFKKSIMLVWFRLVSFGFVWFGLVSFRFLVCSAWCLSGFLFFFVIFFCLCSRPRPRPRAVHSSRVQYHSVVFGEWFRFWLSYVFLLLFRFWLSYVFLLRLRLRLGLLCFCCSVLRVQYNMNMKYLWLPLRCVALRCDSCDSISIAR